MKAIHYSNLHLLVHFRYATLFIKGKVFVEEFEREPKLTDCVDSILTIANINLSDQNSFEFIQNLKSEGKYKIHFDNNFKCRC